jgi:Ca2+-binding EF-hand superfamily protein
LQARKAVPEWHTLTSITKDDADDSGRKVQFDMTEQEGAQHSGFVRLLIQPSFEGIKDKGGPPGGRGGLMADPSFKFQRMDREVDWDEVENADIDDILDNGDTISLSKLLPTLIHADIDNELEEMEAEVDPELVQAFKIMQYSTQYLVHCHKKLADRCQANETEAEKTRPSLRSLHETRRRQRREIVLLRKEADEQDATLQAYTLLLQSQNPDLARLMDESNRPKRDQERDTEERGSRRQQKQKSKHQKQRRSSSEEGSDSGSRADDDRSTEEQRKKSQEMKEVLNMQEEMRIGVDGGGGGGKRNDVDALARLDVKGRRGKEKEADEEARKRRLREETAAAREFVERQKREEVDLDRRAQERMHEENRAAAVMLQCAWRGKKGYQKLAKRRHVQGIREDEAAKALQSSVRRWGAKGAVRTLRDAKQEREEDQARREQMKREAEEQKRKQRQRAERRKQHDDTEQDSRRDALVDTEVLGKMRDVCRKAVSLDSRCTLRAVFGHFDVRESGEIDRQELRDGLDALGIRVSRQQARRLVRKFTGASQTSLLPKQSKAQQQQQQQQPPRRPPSLRISCEQFFRTISGREHRWTEKYVDVPTALAVRQQAEEDGEVVAVTAGGAHASLQASLSGSRSGPLAAMASSLRAIDFDYWGAPLLETNYYEIVTACMTRYDNASTEVRHRYLQQSFVSMGIDTSTCQCARGCQRRFNKGVVCDYKTIGDRSVSSDNPASEASTSRMPALVFPNFARADPDDLAIHLWTYSMVATPAMHTRLNEAILADDRKLLQAQGYVMCALDRWIRDNPGNKLNDFKGKYEVTLYRGTPLAETQEVPFEDQGSGGGGSSGRGGAGRMGPVKSLQEEANPMPRRMPMYVSATKSKTKALECCWPGQPVLEFKVPAGCKSCAPVSSLSHFPDEQEWLMRAYTPVRFVRQRVEKLSVGSGSWAQLCDTLVVTYEVLEGGEVFAQNEALGEHVESCVVMCDVAKKTHPGGDGEEEREEEDERYEAIADRLLRSKNRRAREPREREEEKKQQQGADDRGHFSSRIQHIRERIKQELELHVTDQGRDPTNYKAFVKSIEELYNQFDTDGSGEIDPEEVVEMLLLIGVSLETAGKWAPSVIVDLVPHIDGFVSFTFVCLEPNHQN